MLFRSGVPAGAVSELKMASENGGLPEFHRRNAQLLIDHPELLPLARHWRQAYLIQAYIRIGRKEDALQLLEQAFAEGSPVIAWLKVDLRFEMLRDDLRYLALVRKAGFPE